MVLQLSLHHAVATREAIALHLLMLLAQHTHRRMFALQAGHQIKSTNRSATSAGSWLYPPCGKHSAAGLSAAMLQL